MPGQGYSLHTRLTIFVVYPSPLPRCVCRDWPRERDTQEVSFLCYQQEVTDEN